ncbi:MAG: GHMP kinase [Methanosphaera stadtmanae]|nr:GHMP kinase [Methanosphaera stadtmanae]
MINKLKVFVPAHITGFFEIVPNSNPLLKGSRGAGITLDEGVTTETTITEGSGNIIIKFNDIPDSLNSISPQAIDIIKNTYKLDLSNYDITVNHETNLPISAGFGTSAGFALGISYTLPKLLGLNLTFNKSGEIAHLTEIEKSSGLGDVISEMHGGLVIRLKEGSPLIAKIDKIPITQPIYVITKTLSALNTKDIIDNPVYQKRINDSGKKLLNTLISNPNIENFVKLSRQFSENAKLINPELHEILEIMDEESIGSSMAMLGNTAFCLSNSPDINIEDCIVTKINTSGIKFL